MADPASIVSLLRRVYAAKSVCGRRPCGRLSGARPSCSSSGAIRGVIGALDQAVEKAPEGEPTMALSCAAWLSHNLQIGSSAAHAQVHLARRLPALPATAAAFERGELSSQQASVVARAVEAVR